MTSLDAPKGARRRSFRKGRRKCKQSISARTRVTVYAGKQSTRDDVTYDGNKKRYRDIHTDIHTHRHTDTGEKVL